MQPLSNKFRILARLAKFALLAIPLLVLAVIFHNYSALPALCISLALLAFLPCFFFVYVLTVLHWKSRYRGRHSDLWGALLILEASGWFKLIYIFRRIIPDMTHRGRYGKDDLVN